MPAKVWYRRNEASSTSSATEDQCLTAYENRALRPAMKCAKAVAKMRARLVSSISSLQTSCAFRSVFGFYQEYVAPFEIKDAEINHIAIKILMKIKHRHSEIASRHYGEASDVFLRWSCFFFESRRLSELFKSNVKLMTIDVLSPPCDIIFWCWLWYATINFTWPLTLYIVTPYNIELSGLITCPVLNKNKPLDNGAAIISSHFVMANFSMVDIADCFTWRLRSDVMTHFNYCIGNYAWRRKLHEWSCSKSLMKPHNSSRNINIVLHL